MKKIFAIMMAALSVFAVSCNKTPDCSKENDEAFAEFEKEYRSVQQNWTMVYNTTVNNEEYTSDSKYTSLIEEMTPVLNGIYQNIENLMTWAEESYNNLTLASELDEILLEIHGEQGINVLLTQFLNVFNDAVGAIHSGDESFETFRAEYDSLCQQWTMVYNSTVNNDLFKDDVLFVDLIEETSAELSGISQLLYEKMVWATESYANGTLDAELEEILAEMSGEHGSISQMLSQAYTKFMDGAAELNGQIRVYEELAGALEYLEQQWTMVFNSTVNNSDNAALYGEMPEYLQIVDDARIALSGVAQNIEIKKIWIEESYQAGTLAEDAEDIYASFEEIQILLTQTLNVYNAAVEELGGGSELDAIYDELVGALDDLDAQWYMVYNATVNNSENAATAKAKGKEGMYEEIVFQANDNLTALRTTMQEKLALIDYSYEDGTLVDKAEEIYVSFETDIQIPLTQVQMTYNQQFAELIGE